MLSMATHIITCKLTNALAPKKLAYFSYSAADKTIVGPITIWCEGTRISFSSVSSYESFFLTVISNSNLICNSVSDVVNATIAADSWVELGYASVGWVETQVTIS